MKLSLVLPPNNFLFTLNPWFLARDIELQVNEISPDTDLMLVWSISMLGKAQELHEQQPHVPYVNYNWDVYEWTRTDARGYDWDGYAEFCRQGLETWVPSKAVGLRMEEYYGDDNYFTVHSFARYWEPNAKKGDVVEDRNFVLNAMRRQPDRNLGWFEEVCEEFKIPYVSADHGLSEREYRDAIQHCSFIVCPYYEASTGGLSLLEAYHHGKPVLFADSPYQGANEYFGEHGNRFRFDSKEDLGDQIVTMFAQKKVLDVPTCRELTEKYTDEQMAIAVINRIEELL